jgi:CheY-like chemotaxis protein
MPVMDGFETCIALRQVLGADCLPIVMVIVMEDADFINQAYELGSPLLLPNPSTGGS